MRRIPTIAPLLFGLCVAPAVAQLQALRLDGARRATTVVFFEHQALGAVSIQYGDPPWKTEYETFLADGGAKRFRLGRDFWTIWSSSVEMTVHGVRVPAGDWYLGLGRDEEGRFGLLFLDPEKVRAVRAFPLLPETYPVSFSVPLKHDKDPEMQENLRITLLPDREDPADLTLKVAWGHHRLTAPARAELK